LLFVVGDLEGVSAVDGFVELFFESVDLLLLDCGLLFVAVELVDVYGDLLLVALDFGGGVVELLFVGL
jgi:hypothetical protein